MAWALKTAWSHPELQTAVVNANGDWLDFLLADGRTFRFRPGALINPEADEETRTKLLNLLISIGIKQAELPKIAEDAEAAKSQTDSSNTPTPASIAPADTANAPVVPIVRPADYFLASHHDADSIVYLPLTEFLAVALAYDMPETIQPIYYSQIAEDEREVGEMMNEAVFTLRTLQHPGQQAVEIGLAEVAGAKVMTFLQPPNYELSWFADLEIMQEIAARAAEQAGGDIPLFVPAARTKLFIVFASDPHLVDFFRLLLAERNAPDAVYPLPHTVAADGWKEWAPFPGSELAEILGTLRNQFRARSYAAQVKAMMSWGDFGALKPFHARRLKTGERVSSTVWDAADKHGSIPEADFITFLREKSHNGAGDIPAVEITVRLTVAREIWPAGFSRDENVWPPRWEVTGFPDDATLQQLLAATDRMI